MSIPLDIPSLRSWADSKNLLDEAGHTQSASYCPIACYLRDQGADRVSVDSEDIEYAVDDGSEVGAWWRSTSEDLQAVINRVDNYTCDMAPITFAEFLMLLDDVERERIHA